MKKRRGFSLLELLIALSLSSFVILGLLQSYRSLVRYLEKSKELIGVNRRVCLLFNQLERDFQTAFIPAIASDDESSQDKIDGKEAKESQAKDKKEDSAYKKKKIDKKNFFLAEADESGSFTKIKDKKLMPCKFVTLINTNPLQIYGQRKIRYVRIMYALEKNKEHSSKDKTSYNLIRKESRDIENVKMKVNEFDHEQQKNNPIRSHVIAEDIKALYFEYVGIKPPKKDDKEKKEDNGEEIRLFTWGDKDFTQGVVPKYVEVYVDLWDEQLKFSQVFHAILPILSFPTI